MKLAVQILKDARKAVQRPKQDAVQMAVRLRVDQTTKDVRVNIHVSVAVQTVKRLHRRHVKKIVTIAAMQNGAAVGIKVKQRDQINKAAQQLHQRHTLSMALCHQSELLHAIYPKTKVK